MGKNLHIERVICTVCKKAFSSRKGTLQEHAKLTEDKQETLLKCFRWGVQDEGTADIARVDVKTVTLFRQKVARHAKDHHDRYVHGIEARAVECDELYGKHCKGKTWIGAAIALPSLLIVTLIVGARNQQMADRMLAQIWARCSAIGIILTDGWCAYWGAIVRCFGRLFQPRRTGQKGAKKAKRIKFGDSPFYGQVVKRVNQAFALVAVECRAWIGSLEDCMAYLKTYEIGNVVHTIHIERWWGTLRTNLAALRRRSRCLARSPATLSERVWIWVSLYNWVIPHKTLSRKGRIVTPAMAAGLSAKPLSYNEYIRLVVLPFREIDLRAEEKLTVMQSDEWKRAAKRTKWKAPKKRTIWEAPETGVA